MTKPSSQQKALAGAAEDAKVAFGPKPVGDISDPCPPDLPKLRIHVDADRDGKVDADTEGVGGWSFGKGKKGAIILVNNDDDAHRRKLDNSNSIVDTDADVPDIAPLVLRRTPAAKPFPPGYRAFLSVSKKRWIRIFDQRTGSGSEIIGPGIGKDTFEIPDLSLPEFTYGMEAVTYLGRNFDGYVDLTLEVRNPRGMPCGRHRARVRVAPWLMPNHLDATDTVFVMDLGAWNSNFRSKLKAAVISGGVPAPTEVSGARYGNDRWMQDVMELGFSSFPRLGTANSDFSRHLPVVLRTAADRGYRNPGGGTGDDYPEQELLGLDFGYHQTRFPKERASSLNSFGNLECSPPVEVAGRVYPFGRIVFGEDPTRPMDDTVRYFLVGQHAQAPFSIDTSWLIVGHVDEVISFCPMPSSPDLFPKFRVFIASPAVALDILRDLQRSGNGAAPMFQGIDQPSSFDATTYLLQTPDAILADASFVAVQNRVQTIIDGVQRTFENNLGLKKEHFIRLPVLFRATQDPSSGQFQHVAYTPGVVNMLVVTRPNQTAVLCIPKPFGPLVGAAGGPCEFEKKITMLVAPTGNDIQYIDDFVPYHQAYGEIHCGTNSKRKPRTDLWWWEVEPT